MEDGLAVSGSVARRALVAVVVALSLAAVGPGVAADHTADAERVADDRQTLDPDRVEADRTILTIDLQENGTAVWTIEYFVELETREDEQAWEDLQNDVETNTSDYLGRFSERIRSTVGSAENETGRTMSAERFAVETRTQPQFGVVEYQFRWNAFAVADGDRIRAGDAIDGFLLDTDTRLVMGWPDGYALESPSPAPTNERSDAVVWRGSDTDFVSGEPRVVVRSNGTPGPTTPGTTTADGTTAGSPTTDAGTTTQAGLDDSGSDLPVAMVAGLFGLIAVAALAWYGYRQRGDAPGGAESTDDRPDDDGGAIADGDGAGTVADDGTPSEDLLSNEERVLKLVRNNGGRMKQQEVVDELDWTEAKTSQVVRGLRDDDELDGFRLGRENVLKLPGEDEEI